MKLVATIGPKGQLCLPVSVRRELGLGPGDKVCFRRQADGGFVIETADALLRQTEPRIADAPLTPAAEGRPSLRLSRAERGLQALRGGEASEELY